MHSSSNSPRKFHNRSGRYLGVLVAAALITTLALPEMPRRRRPSRPPAASSTLIILASHSPGATAA